MVPPRTALLLFVGLLAMAGDLLGSEPIYALGLATGASPAPKVFTAREGLEGFAASYVLRWDEADGAHALALTPEVYARLDGPYNRRNVYGAALAGGPFLVAHPVLAPLHGAVVDFAFCEEDVLRELGVDARPTGPVRLEVIPREGTVTDLPLTLEVAC